MKICASFAEALKVIKSNSTVYVHGAAATPVKMLEELAQNSDHLRNVEMIHIHTEGDAPYSDPKYQGRFHITSLFTGKNLRGKLDYERIDYLPCFLSEIPLLFRRGIKKLDVALI